MSSTPARQDKHHKTNLLLLCVVYFTYAACLLLIIPVWPALTAGLAGVSIVFFGTLLLVLAGSFALVRSSRIHVIVAVCAALAGLIYPQVSYSTLANQHEATLSFHPVRYLTFSGATSLKPTKQTVYKHTENQALQIAFYEGKGSGQRPLVMLLHGGAWQYGNHLETGEWPKYLTEAGYHVASIEYRLSAENRPTWQQAPADVHAALNYMRAHSQDFSVDQNRIHILGQSAGGHLALLEAYRFAQITSVIALYAPIDLELDYKTSRDKSAEINFLGGTPNQQPERYKALSPITHVSKHSPRTLLVYSNNDDLVHPRNAHLLSSALSKHGVEHNTVMLPLTGHSFENQHGGFATQITQQQVLHFLSK